MTFPGSAVTPLVSLPAVLVEAFADGPCCGNGAAVVQLHQPMGDGASSGMIRLSGSGHLLWNGTLRVQADGSGADSWASLAACA